MGGRKEAASSTRSQECCQSILFREFKGARR